MLGRLKSAHFLGEVGSVKPGGQARGGIPPQGGLEECQTKWVAHGIPPATTSGRFDAAQEKEPGHFLWVHRLVPYKQPELVMEAFRDLPYRLTMVGVGPLEGRLRGQRRYLFRAAISRHPGEVDLLVNRTESRDCE